MVLKYPVFELYLEIMVLKYPSLVVEARNRRLQIGHVLIYKSLSQNPYITNLPNMQMRQSEQ